MKLFFLIFSLLILSTYSSAEIKNKIIAKVGKEIITSVDLVNEMTLISIINRININNVDQIKLRNGAMKNLINLSIKNNEISNFDVDYFDKKQLEDILKTIVKKSGLTRAELTNLLKKNGIEFSNLEERYSINLKWNSLIYELYKNQIKINPLELENELKKYLAKENVQREYNLSEIEFTLNGKSLLEMKNIINKAIKEEGFERAVEKYSISVTNLQKGKIGWVKEESLETSILSEIKKIKIGQFTNPIQNTKSFVILQINNFKEIKLEKNTDIKDINQIKNNIITIKKQKKLNLYSRSHYTKIENSILVEVNE